MAINPYCPVCKSSFKIGTRKCTCGSVRSGGYKVRVIGSVRSRTKVVHGSLKLAKAVERQFKSDIINDTILGIKDCLTVDAAMGRLLNHNKIHKRRPALDRSRYRLYLKDDIGHLKLDAVKTHHIQTALGRMAARGLKPATQYQALALVKRLFSFSIQQGVFNGSNPASRIKLKFDNRMYDQLDAEGVRQLLTVLDADPNRRACLVLKFLLAIGRRKSEVLSLT